MTSRHAPRAKPGVRPPLALGGRRNRRKPAGPGLLAKVGVVVGRVFPWALGFTLVVGIGGGAYVGWQRIMAMPALQLQHVVARGGERTSAEAIVAAAALKTGSPILKLDLDNIGQRVRKLPWVHHVTVRRQLPDTVSIEITEYVPMLLVSMGTLYVADVDGALFKAFNADDGLDLPVLTGLGSDTAHDDPVILDTVRGALALSAGVESHKLELGDLQEMHIDEDLGWTVTVMPPTVGAEVRVHLGADPLTRLPLTLTTLRELDAHNQKPAIIWADAAKTPDRVQVQLRIAKKLRGGSHGTEG